MEVSSSYFALFFVFILGALSITNMTVRINYKDKPILKINLLGNRYVTDGNIWTIDEIIIELYIYSLYIVNYLISKNNPIIIHSDN